MLGVQTWSTHSRERPLCKRESQVRDEETEDCGDSLQEARRLPDSFVELAESGLGELSEACVKAGLANLVVAALKLNPESAGVVKKVEAESTRN